MHMPRSEQSTFRMTCDCRFKLRRLVRTIFPQVVLLPATRAPSSAGCNRPSSQRCASLSLSLTPTLMVHYYFTPSFLIYTPQSTTTLTFISTLSTSSMYFSLLCFIPLEWTPESYNHCSTKTQLYSYTVIFVWLAVVGGGGDAANKTFIDLKSRSQSLYKSLLFTCRRGNSCFQRLCFWIDTQSTVEHGMKHFPFMSVLYSQRFSSLNLIPIF